MRFEEASLSQIFLDANKSLPDGCKLQHRLVKA